MKVARCRVGLTYEGINKFLICDIVLTNEPTAQIVFEWELQGGFRRAKTWFQAPIHDLQSTGENLCSLQTILDVDSAPREVRAYLLQNCF